MKRIIFILSFILLTFLLYSQVMEITDTTNYYDGNVVVVGLIRNNIEEIVSFVSLSIVYKDDSDQIVYTDSTYAFCPILPDWVVPFKFLVPEDKVDKISGYVISVDNYHVGGTGSFNFKIGQLYVVEKNNLFHKYVGEITNIGEYNRSLVRVAFIGYDVNKKIVFYESTYVKKNELAAGGKSIFEILVPPDISSNIETYLCFAYAR